MAPDHPFVPGAPAHSLLDGLDPAQLEAVITDASPLCILAGAGSGKTRVLTRRIAHRAATGSALSGHVLALTFTRRAAGELGRRLAALGVRDRVATGTFHAAAWSQLRRWWADTGGWAPALLDHKGRLLHPLVDGVDLTVADLATEIEWAKARIVAPEGYEAAVAAVGRRPPLPAAATAELYRRYEQEKRRRRLVDFDDLVLLCADALETDTAFAAACRWRHRHIFVDEFQDVNPAQFRLLEAWRAGRPDLCVVGDPDQAIYGWNGADPGYLTHLRRRMPDATVVHLDRNYRSTPQVVSVANAVLDGRRAPGAHQLRPTLAGGPVPTVAAFPTDADEAAGVADSLVCRHRDGRRWSDQAVLARTRAQLVILEEALARAGVPCRIRGAASFLARPEVVSALDDLRRLPRGTPLAVARADLPTPDDTPAPAGSTSPGSAADRNASLRELSRMMAEQLAHDPVVTADAFAGWLGASLRSDEPDVGAEAVTLSTFHAAKGLEWPVVFLTGLEQGLVPVARADTPEARAEERRLLYVAVTRASDELHCSWAERRRFGTSSVARSPSPWLATVEAAVAALHESLDPAGTPAGWRRHLDDTRNRVRALDGGRAAPRRGGVDVGERADPAVLAALRSWRAGAARAAGVPAFVVLHDSTLAAVAEARPVDRATLLGLPGVGPVKAERYGEALLAVVAGAVAS
jgi:DNA helicase-2/ATP-dependent DNA helicase PcrA